MLALALPDHVRPPAPPRTGPDGLRARGGAQVARDATQAARLSPGESHMKGNPQVIDHLNKGLREELTAINQYFVHAEMCHNWGYHTLGAHIRKQSIDEMRHAEAFVERLLFLDATPTMEPMPLNIGQTVRKQLESDLALEYGAVKSYNEAIVVCREAGDNTSRELFERLLKDEEGHVDWLETQLHQMGEIGYERYLSQQVRGEGD
jgi:bacterioferritin